MPALITNHGSGPDSRNRSSNDSYDTPSVAATLVHSSPPNSEPKASPSSSSSGSYESYSPSKLKCHQEDISPDTSLYSRSSVDTYASSASEEELDDLDLDSTTGTAEYDTCSIPPLPVYRREVVEPNVRPSTPQDFAKLFPSLNRLSIRHDEFTPDGNMNLRIDTVVTGRRRTSIQLFHLRMYDLAKREFSLRRYCRDSGREVCNSKRKYVEPPAPKPQKEEGSADRPTLQRSLTSAIKTLSGGNNGKPGFNRANSGGSIFRSRTAAKNDGTRPGTSNSHSSSEGDDESLNATKSRLSLADSRLGFKSKPQRPLPTNTIKLEFSNYARVDVRRCGGSRNKRYDFDWWGHRYSWRRSVDKQLNSTSLHLVRDGNTHAPVAHIVPETRSPNQVFADENAGGWVPPCFMWIADNSIVDAQTDVAE